MASAAQLKALRKKFGLGEFRKKKRRRKKRTSRRPKTRFALLPKRRARRRRPRKSSPVRRLPESRRRISGGRFMTAGGSIFLNYPGGPPMSMEDLNRLILGNPTAWKGTDIWNLLYKEARDSPRGYPIRRGTSRSSSSGTPRIRLVGRTRPVRA